MNYERIDDSPVFDGPTRESHEYRYRVAAMFSDPGDTVLDACCGTGYGERIFGVVPGVVYIGADKHTPQVKPTRFYQVDFENETCIHTLSAQPYDVWSGLECIEHLNNQGVENFVELAKQAKKTIVVSTPIIPNSNPYHKQQFIKQHIEDMFVDDVWYLHWYEEQNATYGIFIFKRI